MEPAETCVRAALSLGVYGVLTAAAPPPHDGDTECTFLSEGHAVYTTENPCFCYKPRWSPLMLWLALQVHVQTIGKVFVLTPLNCSQPEDVRTYVSCWLHRVWKPEDSTDVNQLDEGFCFHVNSSGAPTAYSVTVGTMWFNLQTTTILIGILLFCLADKLSRSSIFFYAAGAMLGMAASVLFLVIVLKRFISKPNTLWLLISLCCFLTAYVGQFLNQHMAWIWAEKKPYVIGYLVTLALISFSACYSHGPLRSEFSFSLFTWTLQTIACFLIYFGHPVNEIAFAVIAVLLSSKGLPRFFRAIRYIYSKVRRKKPIFGFLTEEEYNEQCELETLKALKDLRDFCSSPDFNSWLTVSRLSSPKRFAEFVLGSSHVSCEEVTAHEQQYGLGSLFMEDLIVQDREVEHNLQVTVGQNENDYTEDLEMDQHSA
ncbi:nuclear envelope integral membrane protein 2 isoform X1 [Eleutherodactylus coqui]|uniref:nuclear envelope integral membrane protein 2 isoform X1 n=1 Tax=Eleutherodactylus coqui TaxID=57060 RepID=UPI0034619C52